MKELLLARVSGNTELECYLSNDGLLDYALLYAENEIRLRRGINADTELEQKYHINCIEGAIWYLSRIGTEGYASTAENGISINYKDVPDWLKSVTPSIGVVRS